MRVSTIPLAALIGLPALSAAFLLPPPLDLELSPLFNTNEAEVAVLSDTPKSAVVKGTHIAVALPCIGCTWHKDVSDEEGVPFTKGLESELVRPPKSHIILARLLICMISYLTSQFPPTAQTLS